MIETAMMAEPSTIFVKCPYYILVFYFHKSNISELLRVISPVTRHVYGVFST